MGTKYCWFHDGLLKRDFFFRTSFFVGSCPHLTAWSCRIPHVSSIKPWTFSGIAIICWLHPSFLVDGFQRMNDSTASIDSNLKQLTPPISTARWFVPWGNTNVAAQDIRDSRDSPCAYPKWQSKWDGHSLSQIFWNAFLEAWYFLVKQLWFQCGFWTHRVPPRSHARSFHQY